MSAAGRRSIVGAIAVMLVVGSSQWAAAPPAAAEDWTLPEVQQIKSVAVENARASELSTAKVEQYDPPPVTWPKAETVEVDLSQGKLTRAGSGPVRLGPADQKTKADRRATVQVLDSARSEALVGPGVVAVIESAPGTKATVEIDYAGFAAAAGGDFAGRLRLVALPVCALTTPELPECQEQTDLGSLNDLKQRHVSATVTLPDVTPDTSPTEEPATGPKNTARPTLPAESESPAATEPAQAEPSTEAKPVEQTLPVDGEPSETESTADPSVDPDPAGTAEPSETPEAAPAPTSQLSAMVVALAATTSSSQGDFGETSLRPSSTWDAGTSTGEFSWSYPMRVPAVPGGLVPSLGLSYSSGGTDGGVSHTNNQASWVGEGFELGGAYIERKYAACADDKSGGNNSTTTGDLCWYTDSDKTNNEKWDNAFLVMDGHGGQLVRVDDTDQWRLESDDGTRITKIGTVGSNNEYWRVTTPDGTQYFFGKGKSDNASAPATNSKWMVPVAANHSSEPGYNSSFASSFTSRPWRWNLDYVVAPTGNTMTYYWVKEANRYKKNLTTDTSYDRGGYLTRVQYGERKGAETNNASPAKVAFVVEERCDTAISSTCKTAAPTSATAKAWPDVPMDAYCQADYCPSEKVSPSFFTRKRVAQVDTFTRNAGNTDWQPVDSWGLGGSFPKPADGGAVPSLWLSSITHTGKAGGTIALPAVTLTPIMRASRITGSGVGLEKPRLATITAETGAQTIVEYSAPECTQTTVPTEAQIPDNTKRCMPVWYSDGDAAPQLHWFNKLVVTKVTERDPVAVGDVNLTGLGLDIGPNVVTSYTYTGGGAWHYEESPLIKKKYRTWGTWRGYGKVTTTVGTGSTKQIDETLFFRGMHGDKAASGTKPVDIADSTGATWPDHNWLAGMARETRQLNGAVEYSGAIMDPRPEHVVANDGRIKSRQVAVAETRSRQKLAAGGTRDGRDLTVAWDTWGQPTRTEDHGDLAVTGDETCTRDSYATPTDATTGAIDRIATTSTMPALCNVAEDFGQVIDAARHYYGSQPLGSVAPPALETKVEQYTGSGTAKVWKPIAQTVYDQWGRSTQVTDALGNVTTLSYTHTSGGQVATMSSTTPDPDGAGSLTPLTTTTTLDSRLGLPLKRVEPGGQTTEATYDALGRITAVWNPGRARSASASTTYAYTVNKTTGLSTVTTKTLLPNGSAYATTITLFDSLLRTRQVQSPAAISGRMITDTRYDSRGNAVLTDTYYNSGAPAPTLVQPANRADIPTSNRYTYDFAARVTKDAYYSGEVFKWQTLTSYDGDRVKVTPPTGATPTTTVSDIFGRTTQLHQHLGTTTAATAAITRYGYDPAGNLVSMTDPKGNQWSYTWDLQGNKLTAEDPDKGLTSMSYDLAGRQTSSTDARGITLKYFYDTLGRPTKTTKADGTTVLTSAVYDTVKKGLQTSSSRHVSGATFTSKVNSFDAAGRPTSSSVVVPAVAGLIGTQLAGTYTTTTSYNADGSVNTIGLPAAGAVPAETLTHGYTATGLPKTLTGTIGSTPAAYVTDTQYLQYGTVAAVLLGTHTSKAIMASYVRDPGTLRLTETKLNRQVNPGVTDETTTLTYTPGGTITQARAVLASGNNDNQCFGYDYQQQLTEAWTPAGTACNVATRSQATLAGPSPYWSSWAIDTIGKTSSRTDRTVSTSTTTAFTYPADGATAVRPHLATASTATGSAPGTASYAADASGNLTGRPGAGGQQTLLWDDANQLVEIQRAGSSVAKMVYDAAGARLVRQQGTTTTVYLGGTELTLTGSTLSAQRYYSHGGQTWAVRTGASNDTVTTLVPDHQGTTHHQVTNASGALKTTWQNPYGAPRGTSPAGWVGDRGFVGGTKDATGLVRIGARDYDPVLQRFVTVDPIQDVADPLQWNPYLYANNSPITKSDPTGLAPRMCIDYCGSTADRGAQQAAAKRTQNAAPASPSPARSRRSASPSGQRNGTGLFRRQNLSTGWPPVTPYALNLNERTHTYEEMIEQGGRTATAVAVIACAVLAKVCIPALIEGVTAFASGGSAATGLTAAVAGGGLVLGGRTLFSRSITTQATTNTARAVGTTVGDLRAAGLKDAHHIIQDAAVRDLPGYATNAAPGVALTGPSTAVGSAHHAATLVQRAAGGGTYAAERQIGYNALRAAGYSEAEAAAAVSRADAYFIDQLGVSMNTPLRVPGNRAGG